MFYLFICTKWKCNTIIQILHEFNSNILGDKFLVQTGNLNHLLIDLYRFGSYMRYMKSWSHTANGPHELSIHKRQYKKMSLDDNYVKFNPFILGESGLHDRAC